MLTLIPLLFFISSGVGFLSNCSVTSSLSTMALTLEDFIRISDKNRTEDLEKINKMIESGVRAEVERVVKPMQNKNEERFDMLESKMSKLEDAMKKPAPPPPSLPQPVQVHAQQGHAAPSQGQPSQSGGEAPCDLDKIQETLNRARKIISLQPIHNRKDVARQFRMHEDVTTDDQAMKAAVLEFIDCELKCKNVPNIVKVFPPANNPDYDRLYVEFENETAASYVSGFSRVIRKPDHQVSIYVPRSFQPRFRAFNEHARALRTAPGLSPGDVKTKVIYGLNDFVLLTKPRNGRWSSLFLNTENFPPLLPPPGPAQTTDSPPPGRPRGSPSPATPSRGRGSPPTNPPKNTNKRGASSPLENGAKVTRSSVVSALSQSQPCNENTPSLLPATPLCTPPLEGQNQPADEDQASPDHSKSVVPGSVQDNGQFAQTAVCSPSVSNNKHFTFDTRRLSLPASAAQSRSLN